MDELSHLKTGASGRAEAQMVDVGQKPHTRRSATAVCALDFPGDVLARIRTEGGPKGSLEALLEVARTAGILAAKRTGELIPMCHPLGLDHVTVTFEDGGEARLVVRATAACTGPTGVEMEALTAASVAALTVYDMTKALAKGIRVEGLHLVEKTGGKGGTWRAPSADA